MNWNLLRSSSCVWRRRCLLDESNPPRRICSVRGYCDEKSKSPKNPEQDNNPIGKTVKLITDDLKRIAKSIRSYDIFSKSFNTSKTLKDSPSSPNDGLEEYGPRYSHEDIFPTHCDVAIIGGGGVGASVAYWLKEKARDGLNVVVLERDPTVSRIAAIFQD